MTFKVQDAGTLRTITRAIFRQAGIDRQLKFARVYDGGTLRTVAVFAEPLTVAISPLGVTVVGNSSTLTTGTVTASPTGGFAPYTYAWTRLTNGGGNPSTASAPAAATTSFTKTGLAPEQDATDDWRVTVTDSAGTTATADTTAQFFYLTGA